MGCLLPIFAIFMPRIAMALIFLFTNWFAMAFHTALWPLLGFILMPYTTLAWMMAMLYNNQQMSGFWIIILVVAVLLDVGGQGGSARGRSAAE